MKNSVIASKCQRLAGLIAIFIFLFFATTVGATSYKGFIGGDDINWWDGVSRTFERRTSTGGMLELNKIYSVVDVLEVYGDGTDYSDTTINAALSRIGTATKVGLLLQPGTWTVSANTDWSAYTNITFTLPPGAVISRGAYTLNIPNVNAGYYQIFSGTGAITLSGTIREAVAQWWGVDGTADDVPIQAAVNSLSKGAVVFPYYTYGISAAITGKTDVSLIGIGKPVFKQTTADINLIVLSDVTDMEVRDIKFDGQGLGSEDDHNRAIYSADTTSKIKKVKVHHCKFTNMYAFAATFQGPGASVYSYDVEFSDNDLTDMPDEGTNVYYIISGKFFRNTFRNHGKEAIKMSNSYDIDIAHNKIYMSGIAAGQGPAINIGQSMEKVKCISNHVEQGYNGIGIEKGGKDIKVVDNTLKSQGNKGIGVSNSEALEDIDDILIDGNTVDGDVPVGIKVEGRYDKKASRVTVINNNVKGQTTNGNVAYQMVYIKHLDFEGNTSKDSKEDGVILAKISNVNFKSNTIENSRFYGVDTNSILRMVANDNTILNVSQVGASSYDGMSLGSRIDWAATTAYSQGDAVIPTSSNRNGYFYECTTAGTSGGSEPTWSATEGGSTSDGTATWTTRKFILRAENNNIIDDNSYIRYGIASYATDNNFGFNYVKGQTGTAIRIINYYPQIPRGIGDYVRASMINAGSFETAYLTKSADYTLASGDYTVDVDASGGARVITLPSSSTSNIGRIYVIRKSDSSGNTVTVDGNATETINGATTYVLSTQYKYVMIQATGNGTWIVIANN